MSDTPLSPADSPLAEQWKTLLERTPARVLRGRAGPAYSSRTQLELRRDHAFALDAVQAELDLVRDLGEALLDEFRLFEVSTAAATKTEYLRRPDLGRRLADAARLAIRAECPANAPLQVVIGDGLSQAAVARQAPALLRGLHRAAAERGWSFGRPFVVRHCRVGVLNEVGELLDPEVVVLLIGERPGLAAADSLSAYLAYRPRPGHTDAQRNLISKIHDRGVAIDDAVRRIMNLAALMRERRTSGTTVKET